MAPAMAPFLFFVRVWKPKTQTGEQSGFGCKVMNDVLLFEKVFSLPLAGLGGLLRPQFPKIETNCHLSPAIIKTHFM